MSTIKVASDNIRTYSKDKADLDKFCQALRDMGHDVTAVGVHSNGIQSHMLKKSNACDIMIQIAGGLCIGTLGDFIQMIRRGGYHAKKGAIVYNMVANNLNAKTWVAEKAWDWYYSMSVVTPYVGKTLPQVYKDNSDVLVGFADGENIDEVIKNFKAVLGGGSSDNEGGKQGGGGSVLDLIKQVCSDWDPLGPEIGINGDTLTVKRTNPRTATPLTTQQIVRNSVSWNDYDSNTPNSFGSAKDKYLVDRFGEIPLELEVEDDDKAQVLQVNQRGHNHSIDLKCIMNPDYVAGRWVNLTIPEMGITSRPYYISKNAYQEERVMSLTLESAPPSIYVDVAEETSEEEVAETEETTEET
jgi:hypothetical protein